MTGPLNTTCRGCGSPIKAATCSYCGRVADPKRDWVPPIGWGTTYTGPDPKRDATPRMGKV